MSARLRMLRGVMIRRVVTTQRRATCLTGSQMQPAVPDFYALFTFPKLRMFDARNRIYTRARSASVFGGMSF